MKKPILLYAIICTPFFYSQKLSDAYILEKVNGIEISKVSTILKLKKSPKSSIKLGLSSDYYTKGNFSYSVIEEKGDNKADKTYLNYMGDDYVNVVNNLMKEAYENPDFNNIETYFQIGNEKTKVANYDEFLNYYRKYSVLERKLDINSYFKKGDFYYKIQTIYGIVYVHVMRTLPQYL